MRNNITVSISSLQCGQCGYASIAKRIQLWCTIFPQQDVTGKSLSSPRQIQHFLSVFTSSFSALLTPVYSMIENNCEPRNLHLTHILSNWVTTPWEKRVGKKGGWGGIPPLLFKKKRVVPKLSRIGSNLFFLFFIGS